MIFSCLFKNILSSQEMKLSQESFLKRNWFWFHNVFFIQQRKNTFLIFVFEKFPLFSLSLKNNEYKQPHPSEYFISTFCFGSEHYIALCTTFDVSSQLPFSICYQPTSFLLSITLHFVSRFLTWHLKYPSYTSPATSLIRILPPTFRFIIRSSKS